MAHKCLLQRIELTPLSHAFDSRDTLSLGLNGEHQTRLDGRTTQQNRASATVSGIATLFRAGELAILPAPIQETVMRIHLHSMTPPIHRP